MYIIAYQDSLSCQNILVQQNLLLAVVGVVVVVVIALAGEPDCRVVVGGLMGPRVEAAVGGSVVVEGPT